jgi:hypothetical protein
VRESAAITGPVTARDPLHRFEVTLAGNREPSLDVIDAEAGELLGDLELLDRVERDPRRLLAVAKRRVEDHDLFVRRGCLVRGLSHLESLSWWWVGWVGDSGVGVYGAESGRQKTSWPIRHRRLTSAKGRLSSRKKEDPDTGHRH